jgi:glutamate 5-kinase
MKRNSRLKDARRVVVKVGSNVLTRDSGLNVGAVKSISRQIGRLIDDGREVILVSSGAMASGMRKLELERRPEAIRERQAVAAVGQAGLIIEYEKAFKRYGHKAAQVLLTADDLCSRKRYLNGRNTLNTLLEWGVVPIINENDTVMVEEIAVGDNDNLAAMITLLMDADILVNLTDIDGLFTKDPRRYADAELIPEVQTFARRIEQMASDIPGALGTGGMLSKIRAARKVTRAGIPMIITNGLMTDVLLKLFAGRPLGTYFVPKKERLASRKSWIAFTLKPQGTIVIDDGAVNALISRKKSLLPSGIVRVEGDFRVGAPVVFQTGDRRSIGTGLVNYDADDIRRIMGLKTSQIKSRLGSKPYDEVIHRDNLVITADAN